MSAATIQQIRPAAARYEALALAAATALLLGTLALYVQQRGHEAGREPLYEWQVSAFDTLTGADQAVYNWLYTAKEEIPYIYDDINLMNRPGEKAHWPGLEDFQDQELPPFYRDRSWEQNGSLQWTLHEPLAEGEMQGSTMYLGTAGRGPGQGSFLLVIGHVHAGFLNNNAIVIWWNPKNRVEMPESGFRDGLILQGWKEVVPHSGAQEVRRLFGGKGGEGPGRAAEDNAEQVIDDLFGSGK